MRLRIFALVAVLLISGCNFVQTALGVADANHSNQPTFTAPPRFNGLLRDQRPMLQIGLVRQGVQSRLLQESVDGDFVRYLSIDRAAIVLENGLLHSVFGLGEGLMGAELGHVKTLVQQGQPGHAIRLHTYLTGDDQTSVRTFRCQITDHGSSVVDLTTGPVATRLMHETCRENGPDVVFVNQYWVDLNSGEVIQSLQWVGERFGALSMRRLPLQ